jgi:deoxyribonuclease V
VSSEHKVHRQETMEAVRVPGTNHAHLARSIPHRASVVGVAKNPFRKAERFVEVYRGHSQRPLYVSAVNMPLQVAARCVEAMHGPHRLPTLIREADRLCRRG